MLGACVAKAERIQPIYVHVSVCAWMEGGINEQMLSPCHLGSYRRTTVVCGDNECCNLKEQLGHMGYVFSDSDILQIGKKRWFGVVQLYCFVLGGEDSDEEKRFSACEVISRKVPVWTVHCPRPCLCRCLSSSSAIVVAAAATCDCISQLVRRRQVNVATRLTLAIGRAQPTPPRDLAVRPTLSSVFSRMSRVAGHKGRGERFPVDLVCGSRPYCIPVRASAHYTRRAFVRARRNVLLQRLDGFVDGVRDVRGMPALLPELSGHLSQTRHTCSARSDV
ncbi:hypothetical protein CBL_10741 [Carabus blaptoides fortunei]